MMKQMDSQWERRWTYVIKNIFQRPTLEAKAISFSYYIYVRFMFFFCLLSPSVS